MTKKLSIPASSNLIAQHKALQNPAALCFHLYQFKPIQTHACVSGLVYLTALSRGPSFGLQLPAFQTL